VGIVYLQTQLELFPVEEQSPQAAAEVAPVEEESLESRVKAIRLAAEERVKAEMRTVNAIKNNAGFDAACKTWSVDMTGVAKNKDGYKAALRKRITQIETDRAEAEVRALQAGAAAGTPAPPAASAAAVAVAEASAAASEPPKALSGEAAMVEAYMGVVDWVSACGLFSVFIICLSKKTRLIHNFCFP
jgi:hypothetical protein